MVEGEKMGKEIGKGERQMGRRKKECGGGRRWGGEKEGVEIGNKWG